jgi:hypothetical protein
MGVLILGMIVLMPSMAAGQEAGRTTREQIAAVGARAIA